MQKLPFSPWVGKIPWRRKWEPILVLLPRESHGQMILAGDSPWDCKESDTTERLSRNILCVSSRLQYNDLTYIHHKMIITISLVNITTYRYKI